MLSFEGGYRSGKYRRGYVGAFGKLPDWFVNDYKQDQQPEQR